MKVTREQIRRIAELAELHVDEETAVELEGQITRILDYVEQIGELPHEGVLADARSVRLRRDEPRAEALERPPAEWSAGFKGGLFVVPRLGDIDRGEEAP
jgi:aspartyl-tRNA(Asn)/glutamyl-tRNA(Gln) amidotransferase subunit C